MLQCQHVSADPVVIFIAIEKEGCPALFVPSMYSTDHQIRNGQLGLYPEIIISTRPANLLIKRHFLVF